MPCERAALTARSQMWPHRQRSVSPRKIEGALDVITRSGAAGEQEQMMMSERALLSAYLGYPDPAPHELEGPACSAPPQWTRRRPNDGRTMCGRR